MSTANSQFLQANGYESASLLPATHGSATADALIADLEARGLGWSLDNTGRLIEARVWDWPHVIGRYRPRATEPLAKMLAEAMYQVDWTRYPVKSPNDLHQPMVHRRVSETLTSNNNENETNATKQK